MADTSLTQRTEFQMCNHWQRLSKSNNHSSPCTSPTATLETCMVLSTTRCDHNNFSSLRSTWQMPVCKHHRSILHLQCRYLQPCQTSFRIWLKSQLSI